MSNSRRLSLILSGLALVCAAATVLKMLPVVIGAFMTLAFIGVTCLVNAFIMQQNKENKKSWVYAFLGLALISAGIYIVARNVL